MELFVVSYFFLWRRCKDALSRPLTISALITRHQIIMRGVRNIANTWRTVVCTIHQPTTDVFLLFDNLLLLKRGGETVFFGPIGDQARDLVAYLEGIPGTPKLKENHNPATYMLEVIGAGVGSANANDFHQIWKDSALNKVRERFM